MTAYTALRVVEDGVLFYDQHLRRFERGAGAAGAAAFRAFARTAAPGAWTLRFEDGKLEARALPGSRLFDGMPSVLRPSPLDPRGAMTEKPAPPGPYAAVRREGVSVLLTSPDGAEIWESCSAAVLAFDGDGFVHAPDDRPRVRSTAESHARSVLPIRPAPISADSRALVLINAVKGVCLLEPSRSVGVPAAALDELRAAVSGSARRK